MLCIENFNDIKKIELYDTDKLTVPLPLFSGMDYVSSSDVVIAQGATPITLCRGNQAFLPITVSDMSVKTNSNIETPGTSYTCTIDFVTDKIDEDTLDYLRILKRPHHAIVHYFSGQRVLLRTEDTAYKKSESTDTVVNVSLSLVNGQGGTLII